MTYVDGYVIAVPNANRAAYLASAVASGPLFRDFGATRIVESWGDDIPDGTRTDFRRTVQASAEETVVFAFMEYPDKAVRTDAVTRMMADPAMATMDMPFDGRRMVFGGFQAEVDEGRGGTTGYVDGFLVPVAPARKDAYFDMARRMATVFIEHGATRVVEAWGDDVPGGTVTDFYRGVDAQEDEAVVFSWVEWPSKATRDTGWAAAMADDRMNTPPDDMPFDGKRMVYGGFSVLLAS
jgi:uncharacterized protein YbaA (DUF1428 family)